MHVAFIAPEWPMTTHPNGIVTYVHWMREELLRRGHQVSILTGHLRARDSGASQITASRWLRARHWINRLRGCSEHDVYYWGKVLAEGVNRLHKRQPIDVIEMEESFGWIADVARGTSIPTLVKLHGPAFLSLVEEELESPFAVEKIRREGEALRAARVVISPARRTLVDTVHRYRLDPPISRHVVNPLSLPSFVSVWSLSACDRKSLLFVGRFDKRKGGDIVLRAFRCLLDADPSLVLTFVGPDAGVANEEGVKISFQSLKASLFPPNLRDRVLYLGLLSPVEIYALRAKAFAVVVASRWENQSYTALEAMLQGCPLISSDVGGQGELIEHGVSGLLVKSGCVDDLVAKTKMLLGDPDWAATLGQQARQYALRTHSPEAVVSQALTVYDEAIADKKACRPA